MYNENDHWFKAKEIDKYNLMHFIILHCMQAKLMNAQNTKQIQVFLEINANVVFSKNQSTWLLTVFMYKLPLIRKFIGLFGEANIIFCGGDKYHTDFGGHNYLQFFLQLKTNMTREGEFFCCRNFYNEMYREDVTLDFVFESLVTVLFLRVMKEQVLDIANDNNKNTDYTYDLNMVNK